MAELAPLVGGGSVFLVLAVVIGYLLKSNRDDRDQAEKQITAANQRAKDARAEAAELEKELDKEQARRREAEEQRADFALEVKKLRHEMAGLRAEIAELRETVT